MTNEEAKIYLERVALATTKWQRGSGKTVTTLFYQQAIEKSLEALEKQIPKKVIIKHEKYRCRYNDKYFCPSCGENAETDCGDPFENYGLDWCNHFGQALDWGK